MILVNVGVFLGCLEFHGLSNVCNISKIFFFKKISVYGKVVFCHFFAGH